MYNRCLDSLPWLVCFILINMHPWAAIGASFGCCFMLSRPPKNTPWYSIVLLTAFSWGMGYAAGEFFYGGGPPYSVKAMGVACFVSAVSSVVFSSFVYAVENKENLPKWMQDIMDRIQHSETEVGKMEVETLLLSVRLVSCALIMFMLFAYRDRHAKWKPSISFVASIVSGLAFALIFFTVYFWHKQVNAWYLPWLTAIPAIVAIRLVQTRGNMSAALKIRKGNNQ